MTDPFNVDICVTCVCEKPPKLPLREELPSLGIEVIYNAHGVGAKATKQELQRKLTKFQRDQHKNSQGVGHPHSQRILCTQCSILSLLSGLMMLGFVHASTMYRSGHNSTAINNS